MLVVQHLSKKLHFWFIENAERDVSHRVRGNREERQNHPDITR